VYVDSHCHLNYLEDPAQALVRARARGVHECLCIGVEQDCIEDVLAVAESQSGVWASVGEHPGSCSGDASWVQEYLHRDGVVAVGEMGLDYHYVEQEDQRALQRHTFSQQLAMASAQDLPAIVHTRSAESDTLALIEDCAGVRGVLHCFTESWAMAEQALAMGFYISISGIVTFKNGDNVRDVARKLPLDRLLIETDAPWLAPVPNRGKKNEPAFVVDTAEYLAGMLEMDVAALAEITRDNFFRLFSRAG
jgi:TatD DNase family protein